MNAFSITNPCWSNSPEAKILLRTKLGLFPSEEERGIGEVLGFEDLCC
jgi:hypothetical protein